MTKVDERLDLSIVVPVFNESSGIEVFCADLRSVLDGLAVAYEVLLVDDGSFDGTADIALNLGWSQLSVVRLTRNVGHQFALEAGLANSRGERVVTMDGDGQHPPSLIPDLLNVAVVEEADVVYTMRSSRKDDAFGKRTAALAYYKAMRWLTDAPIADSQADFRLVSRRVLEAVDKVSGDRVLRLLLPSMGFRSAIVEYETLPRISGKGRFGLRRQFRLASNSVIGYSSKPLRLIAALGVALAFIAFTWLVAVVIAYASGRNVEGWTSVMSAVLLVGGLTLLSLSVVGSYVARIHDILKGQPRYFVDRVDSYQE